MFEVGPLTPFECGVCLTISGLAATFLIVMLRRNRL